MPKWKETDDRSRERGTSASVATRSTRKRARNCPGCLAHTNRSEVARRTKAYRARGPWPSRYASWPGARPAPARSTSASRTGARAARGPGPRRRRSVGRSRSLEHTFAALGYGIGHFQREILVAAVHAGLPACHRVAVWPLPRLGAFVGIVNMITAHEQNDLPGRRPFACSPLNLAEPPFHVWANEIAVIRVLQVLLNL